MFLQLAVKSFLGKVDMSNKAYLALYLCEIIERALKLHEQMCEYKDIVNNFIKNERASNEYYEIVKEGGDKTLSVKELQDAVSPETEEAISIVYKIEDVVFDIGEPFRWRTLIEKIDSLKLAIHKENSKLFEICTKLNIHSGMEYVTSKYPLDGFLECLEETKYKLITLIGE